MHINLNWRCQYDCVEDKINLIIGNFLDWIILQKIILSTSSMYFTISLLFPPGKRSGPCIWTNLNILHPRMLYAKSGWIWLHCSLKVDILFLLFPNYFLLGKDVVLHLNKLESPSPKDVCAKSAWNWPSGSWVEENVKSFQLRWAKN